MTSAMVFLLGAVVPGGHRGFNRPYIDEPRRRGQPVREGQKQGKTDMPLPADTDVTTPKYLRDKYAIVGIGETSYTRGSGKTTRALGTWALRNAIADAGLKPSDIDGMLSYSGNDSTASTFMARRPRR
jgi:hypothetical protein